MICLTDSMEEMVDGESDDNAVAWPCNGDLSIDYENQNVDIRRNWKAR